MFKENNFAYTIALYQKNGKHSIKQRKIKKKLIWYYFSFFMEAAMFVYFFAMGAAMFVYIFAMTAAILNYETLKIAQLQKKHICVFSRESWIYGYLLPCRWGVGVNFTFQSVQLFFRISNKKFPTKKWYFGHNWGGGKRRG